MSATGSGAAIPSTAERLRSKLALLREVALGLGAAQRELCSNAIENIRLRKEEDVKKHSYFRSLMGVEFYAMEKRPRSAGATDCKGQVPNELWRAAITYRMCTKTVYSLIPLVRRALKGDRDIEEITMTDASGRCVRIPRVLWRQMVVTPEHILFSSNPDGSHEEVPVYRHDVMSICCRDGNYVVDFTGDQFGLDDWIFTAKDYGKLIWNAVPQPSYIIQQNEVTRLEKEERRLHVLRRMVQIAVVKEWLRWGKKGVMREDIHLEPASERDQLLQGVADRTQQYIVKQMRKLGK